MTILKRMLCLVMGIMIEASALAQEPHITPVNFKSYGYFPAIDSPRDMKVADFDNDGDTDVAIINDYYVSIAINRDGAFDEIRNFAHPTFFATMSLEPADHNNDGLLDLYVSFNSDSIAVLTNLGEGDFSFTHKYRTGTQPGDLKAADFNHDGLTDLAIANAFAQKLLVFINSPQGLQPPVDYTIGTGISLSGGDFNHDGHTDLAVTNVDEQRVDVLINNGAGVFQIQSFDTDREYPADLIVLDINNDQVDDIVVTYYNESPGAYISNGTGFDFEPLAVSTGTGSGIGVLAAADLNTDDFPDLVSVDWDNYLLRVYMNNTDGTFANAATYPTGAQPHDPVIYDFDGDDQPDIAFLSLSNLVVFANDGGTFELTGAFGPSYPVTLAAGDFNNDGLDDVALANLHQRSINISINTGDGVFESQKSYGVGRYPIHAVSHDMNGDNKLDLVVANAEDSTISVLRGVGDGTFLQAQNYKVGKYPIHVSIADMNNDTRPDIITADAAGNTVSVLLQSAGGFLPATKTQFTSVYRVEASDFNGDNLPDLVFHGSYPIYGLYLSMNAGDGAFAPPVLLTHEDINDIKLADVDGDNLTDIMAARGSYLLVYKGQGNGTVASSQSYNQGYECGNISMGDFNGDGIPDVATSAYGNGGIYVLPGDGSGGFANYIVFPRPEAPLDMVVGNFDGNEKTDLAISAWPGNSLAIMRSLPVLKITALDAERYYGHPNPEFEVAFDGLQGSDQVTVTYLVGAYPLSHPGTYAIEPVPDSFAKENYAVDIVKGILTILKAPLKVIVSDTTRMFSLPNPEFKGSIIGVIGNDLVAAEYWSETHEETPIGQYPIHAYVYYPEDLYELEIDEGVLTITLYVGMESDAARLLQLYPNPGRGDFEVTKPDGSSLDYVIEDPSGRRITQGTLSESPHAVSIRVPAGLYFVRFSNGQVRKLVVK